MTTQVTMTEEERRYLVALLDAVCRDKHVEIRRTEFSSSLHDALRHEENLLRALLEKLQATEPASKV